MLSPVLKTVQIDNPINSDENPNQSVFNFIIPLKAREITTRYETIKEKGIIIKLKTNFTIFFYWA